MPAENVGTPSPAQLQALLLSRLHNVASSIREADRLAQLASLERECRRALDELATEHFENLGKVMATCCMDLPRHLPWIAQLPSIREASAPLAPLLSDRKFLPFLLTMIERFIKEVQEIGERSPHADARQPEALAVLAALTRTFVARIELALYERLQQVRTRFGHPQLLLAQRNPRETPEALGQLGKFLNSIPVISWPGKGLSLLSGVSDVSKMAATDANNPFLFYHLGVRCRQRAALTGAWRAFRLATGNPFGVIAGLGLRSAVNWIDGNDRDPAARCFQRAAILAGARLAVDPQNDHVLLLMAGASFRLACIDGDLEWLERARRCYIILLARTTDKSLAGDAAIGLKLLYEAIKMPQFAQPFEQVARQLGRTSAALGARGPTGSFHDVGLS